MYVCLCKGITEKHIKEAVAEGVQHFRALREKTGVATQCGKCCMDVKSCVKQSMPAGDFIAIDCAS